MKTTVKTEIDAVSEVYRGHGVPTAALSRWLSDVDAYIAREILHIDDWQAEYSYEDSPDDELLVSDAPYRRIYFLYLSAMIDFVCKQYNTYANEIGEYNRALDDYRHYIVCRYNPASVSGAVREGYYISPYALAVKHGFAGTEEEWLEYLRPIDESVAIIAQKLVSGELKGEQGEKGEKGDSYTLTDEDKTEIANEVLALLPNASGVSF